MTIKKETEKTPSISDIKVRITTALENQGSYNKGMDMLIEVTAFAFRSLYEISERGKRKIKPTLNEKTREGNIKIVPNPIYRMQIDQIELIRKLLRELRLTSLTVEGGSEEDEIDKLYESVNGVEE